MFIIISYLLLLPISQSLSYYDLLGVDRNTDQREIKKAYYQLALTQHPDKLKNPTEHDKNRYMDIVKAYETLSDSTRKQLYDLGDLGENGEESERQYTDQSFAFKLFTKGFRFETTYKPRIPKPATLITIVHAVPGHVLYTGILQKLIRYNRTSFCTYCNATGSSNSEICPLCNGTCSREYITVSETKMEGMSVKTTCSLCGGSGHVHEKGNACPHCHGSGIRVVEEYVDLEVDPGIHNGAEFTFRRMGNEQFGRRRGDVLVRVVAGIDSLYSVDGYNIRITVWISRVESLVGFRRAFSLPSNETVSVVHDKRCRNGTTILIPEKGIPHGSSGVSGSLILTMITYETLLLTRKERLQLQSSLGESYSHFVEHLTYLAEESVRLFSWLYSYSLSLEELLYSYVCLESLQICQFSITNIIVYTLYSCFL